MRLSLIFLSLIIANVIFCQSNNYVKIEELIKKKKYADALSELRKLSSNDTLNGKFNLYLGICYYYLNYPEEYVFSNLNLASKKNIIDAYFYLGLMYHKKELFDDALDNFHKYQSLRGDKTIDNDIVEWHINKTLNAKEMMKYPVNVVLINLGANINTEYPEYLPLINADENILLFTSRRFGSTGNKKDPLGRYFEDIYYSIKQKKSKYTTGTWLKAKNIGHPVNTDVNDACVSISADGQKIFILRENPNTNGSDLYLSFKDNDNWTVPEKLPEQINSKYMEKSASLSPDDKTLYFSSNRPGGYGGLDIYRVVLLPNGKWSKAQNLGPIINTPYDEDFPFIHYDNKTLYFSSKGHKNMGGYDIFYSKKNDEGIWSEPENLGYPINTVNDDIYFVVTPDAQYAYMSSIRDGGFGNLDIYKVDMSLLQNNIKILKGFVLEKESKKAVTFAKAILLNMTKKRIDGIYNASSDKGKFIFVVDPAYEYKLMIEAEGYYPFSREIYPDDILMDEQIFKFFLDKKSKK